MPDRRRARRALVLSSALATALGALPCAPAVAQSRVDTVASPATPVGRYFDLVRSEFSGDRALRTVAFVEQRWRVPGNTGFDESIGHVESLLRAAGYLREDGAPDGARLTYRVERRPMRRDTWEPHDASLTIVGQDSALLRFATNRNMLAMYSFSTPPGGVEAEVVDVGAGRASDFDGRDVAGKIVLGDASVGRLFAEAVQRRGALGVLAYAMPDYTKPAEHPTSIQFSGVPIDTTRRAWGILLSHGAREELRDALARGPVRVRVTADARQWRAEELTVVAEVRGVRAPEERFVFSAHVQEPGANDNASGVGTATEMARTLATLVRTGEVSPARTITFLWGDEIKQTRDFLADDSVRARGVRWGMSLDMVGEDTRKTGGTFLIEKMPDPSAVWTRGADHHTEWGGRPLKVSDIRPHYYNDFVLARAREQGAFANWVVDANPFEGGSDHTPFLDAGKPGVLLWHFTDVFYHTDNDRLDKVSPRTMANVGATALVSALVLTSGNQAAAAVVVDDVTRAALARLDTEERLSRAAVADGGAVDEQARILRTWTSYYADALRAAADVEIGGASGATGARIDEAVRRVTARGAAALRAIAAEPR